MTLTLSPEIEKALTETAIKSGRLPVGQTGPRGLELRAQVNTKTPSPAELTAEEKEQWRQEALSRIRSGYFAERLSSSEEFSVRKAEEKR